MPSKRAKHLTKGEKRSTIEVVADALGVDNPTPEEEEEIEYRPGMTKPSGEKVPWTYRDLEAEFPMVTFIPEENTPVIWNSLKYDLFTDREITVPKPIYDLYMNKRRSERQQSRGTFVPGYGWHAPIGHGYDPKQFHEQVAGPPKE